MFKKPHRSYSHYYKIHSLLFMTMTTMMKLSRVVSVLLTGIRHTQRCVRIHSFNGAGCDLKITWWWMIAWMNGKYNHNKNERTMKRPVEGLKSMWRWNESEKEEEENRQFSLINFIAVSAKFSHKLAFNRLTYVFSPISFNGFQN